MAVTAGSQHGVISRAQLIELGLSSDEIDWRVRAGRLHRLHRGVFAVGHPAVGRRGAMLAAVLACGEGAALSHLAAAELHGLRERQTAVIDVIAKNQAGRGLAGVRWHRGKLRPDEVTTRAGITCTTVGRTLVDAAGVLGRRSLRALVEEAAVGRHLDVSEIDRLLSRGPRRGAPQLREVLRPWRSIDEPPRLRSRLEAWLLSAAVEAELPRPRCNVPLELDGEWLEVDFLWEPQRVVVETDGRGTHATDPAFNRDRRRDQLLAAAGYRSARVTWWHMEHEQEATLARLRRMLERDAR